MPGFAVHRMRVPLIPGRSATSRYLWGPVMGMVGALLGWALLEPLFREGGAQGAAGLANAFQFPLVTGMIAACVRAATLPRHSQSGSPIVEFCTGFAPAFAAAFLLLIPARLVFRRFSPGLDTEVALLHWAGLTSSIVGRGLAWGLVGGALGLGIRLGSGGSRSVWATAAAGCAAGLLAGFSFDPIHAYLQHHGFSAIWPSRAAGFLILGGVTGVLAGTANDASFNAPGFVGAGPYLAGHYPVGSPPCLIGSDQDCDIVLPSDLGVHPVHAIVSLEADCFRLRSAGRRSGTRVNGESVAQVPLKHGDRIQIGLCALVFSNPLHRGTGSGTRWC